jgi:DNA-directed RNA polymerase specialized sigma24 family protein
LVDVAHPLQGVRSDASEVDAYVREHSAHVPAAQLDVYVAYWVSRQSIAEIASLEGLKRDAVAVRIKRLKRRVRKWVARQRPARAA